MFLIMMVIVMSQRAAARKEMLAADELWDGGQRADAVSKYKKLEADSWSLLESGDQSRLTRRVIDFHVEAGEPDQVHDWIKQALRRGVDVSSDNAQSSRLIAAVRDEIKAELAAKEAAANNNNSSGDSADADYSMGEEFQLGDYKYVIQRAEHRTRVGSRFSGEDASPGATFVVIHFTIENCSKKTATVLSDDFELVDSEDRKFKPSSNANTALLSQNKDFLLSELQPGIRRPMITAFEIPQSAIAGGLTLIVPKKGIFGFGKATVSLKF